ncbi:GNAT family N-acetyltransferase [Chryseobacterium sp. SSA4.19]|uniref:GNAT family N-acetyltransferase n=1 Tax=Chryseobacterium sp. SSA4.19 TaxID=2919915 RepID=UPI001F4E2A87|nr:GNAT family N-acetyltransferase [Chryseobacterium sp. SSA4.19]MCJ8155268.1 GNAT family N-acetyltransferase [Chryseobacterium sp. SSA4.19]
MEIKKLNKLTDNLKVKWGLTGYQTDTIYAVSAIEMGSAFEFSLREKKQSYMKVWSTEPEHIAQLNTIIEQKHSFGAFHEGELIGWAICDFRASNHSLFIETILVNEPFRNQNVGRMLIKAVNREARELNCRIVELETQNTNYPAIRFYLKCGFTFTGINTKRYPDSAETAVLMSFDLMV